MPYIPKIIHYIWLGNNEHTALQKKCIASWHKYASGFKIVRWDESNCNIEESNYAMQAYQFGKWAFVADYVRIHALLHEGGIYMDTDMLLLKSLDEFMDYRAFAGFQDHEFVNFAICGAIPQHPFMQQCLDWYDTSPFDPQQPPIIPRVVTSVFRQNGMISNCRQNVCGVELLTPEYFYPWPFDKRFLHPDYREFITKNSYAVHLWNYSWKSPLTFQTRLKRLLRPLVPGKVRKFLQELRKTE